MGACVLPFHDSFKDPQNSSFPLIPYLTRKTLVLQDTCPTRYLFYKILASQVTKQKIKIFPKNLKKTLLALV
jgi:hypothetical protein